MWEKKYRDSLGIWSYQLKINYHKYVLCKSHDNQTVKIWANTHKNSPERSSTTPLEQSSKSQRKREKEKERKNIITKHPENNEQMASIKPYR